jgi:hypothetical protein
MDKAATFFRVFDVAFFAPGVVLFAALLRAGYIPDTVLKINLSTIEGILIIVQAVAGVYILGLICHAIQRIIKTLCKLLPASDKSSWYTRLTSNSSYELVTYFWYLRATCWNLAIALAIALFFEFCGPLKKAWVVILLLVGVILLTFLGFDFHKALRGVVGRDSRGGST